jgi:hypothetical protein
VSGGLRFGVFPFGMAGGPDGLAAGPPDDLDRVAAAIIELQGDGPPLLVRMYVAWAGADAAEMAMDQIAQLATAEGVTWDLVLAYRDPGGDIAGWTAFVAAVVQRFGMVFDTIQVTGEANLTHVPAAADGAYPNATAAFVHGLVAAAEAKRSAAATASIGFAVTPEIDPAQAAFWTDAAAIGADLAGAADYAGLDMYPDVFGPRLAPADLDGAVDWLLRSFRHLTLPLIGIGPETPIRVCENGWPTGPDRSEERQAEVLEAVLRAVHARAGELNVTHWELFALRDADSSKDDLFHNFGVLHDDYSPKPAFGRLASLFAELG